LREFLGTGLALLSFADGFTVMPLINSHLLCFIYILYIHKTNKYNIKLKEYPIHHKVETMSMVTIGLVFLDKLLYKLKLPPLHKIIPAFILIIIYITILIYLIIQIYKAIKRYFKIKKIYGKK
jgi:Ca2+/Na+ antiporter